jgi:hypothetical protein
MTPKEKAEQLLNRFYFDTTLNELEASKECALIAVDEIIEQYEFDVASDVKNKRFMAKLNYWDEVKKEIEKL